VVELDCPPPPAALPQAPVLLDSPVVGGKGSRHGANKILVPDFSGRVTDPFVIRGHWPLATASAYEKGLG